jgi:hypothetical protein
VSGVRKEGLATVLAQAISEALQPLRDCIDETHARLSAVEVGIRSAEARSRTIAEIKRNAGIPVSTEGDDAPIIRRH